MPPPVPSPVMELLRTARLRPRMWIVPPGTLLETRTSSPPTTMLPPPSAFPWTRPISADTPMPPSPSKNAFPSTRMSHPDTAYGYEVPTHKRGILDPNVGRVPQVDTVALSPRSRGRDRHAADDDMGVGVRDVDRPAPGRGCEAPSGAQVRGARGRGPPPAAGREPRRSAGIKPPTASAHRRRRESPRGPGTSWDFRIPSGSASPMALDEPCVTITMASIDVRRRYRTRCCEISLF